MTLVVPAGGTLAAVVLLLTTETLPAPLPLLLGGLFIVHTHAGGWLLRAKPIPCFAIGTIRTPMARRWRGEKHSGDIGG